MVGESCLPEGFLEVPFEIYGEDPLWVPERSDQVVASFSPKNPWFETGEAIARVIPGEARIAGFCSPETRIEGEQAVFFGYFETLGDQDAAAALLDEVRRWGKERGARYICGPINFSTYGTYRVRTEVLDEGTPFVGEPYTPLYFAEVLAELGLEAVSPAVTQISPNDTMRPVWQKYLPLVGQLEAKGFRFESMTPEVWLGNLPALHEIINQMFGQNFGYSRLSYELFCRMCGEAFVGRLDPKVSQVVYGPDGSIVAFDLIVPHYGPLMVQGAGEARLELDALRYSEHFDGLKDHGKVGAIHKTLAVHPDYRQTRVFGAMVCKAFEAGDGTYDEWYGALVREDNPSRRFADGVAVDSRRYALFGAAL